MSGSLRGRLSVTNHRGRVVPAILGLVLLGFGSASTAGVELAGGVGTVGWVAATSCLLVCLAGLLDDLTPSGPRGLRGHLRALAAGHVSTGIVKLVVVTGAAAVAVAVVPGRSGAERVAGVVLVAAAANVANGLDVRPARAIKFVAPVLLACLGTPWEAHPVLPGVALGALLVVAWDAGERAMLGDAGANLLGFVAGLAVFHALVGAGVVVAAAVAVGLNVLAETVTLSRAIERLPPLRWYDRLGTAA